MTESWNNLQRSWRYALEMVRTSLAYPSYKHFHNLCHRYCTIWGLWKITCYTIHLYSFSINWSSSRGIYLWKLNKHLSWLIILQHTVFTHTVLSVVKTGITVKYPWWILQKDSNLFMKPYDLHYFFTFGLDQNGILKIMYST